MAEGEEQDCGLQEDSRGGWEALYHNPGPGEVA